MQADSARPEESVTYSVSRVRTTRQVPTRGARQDKDTPMQKPLQALRQRGFSPDDERVELPGEAFLALLTLEPIAVMQAVFVVMRECQTLAQQAGKPIDAPDIWVALSPQDFERIGITSRAHARRGLDQAVDRRYLRREPINRRRPRAGYRYQPRWVKAKPEPKVKSQPAPKRKLTPRKKAVAAQ